MSAISSTSSSAPQTFGKVRVKVVGVGGGGGNTVMRLLATEVPGVEFYCLNTDTKALGRVQGATPIQIGEVLTQGLGAGGDVEVGLKAAEQSKTAIRDALAGADLVFITAGMGGGTGTGAAPVVAEIASTLGALTIAIVTTPFSFEGAKRAAMADMGMGALKGRVDTFIAVSNERLLEVTGDRVSVQDAFKRSDEVSAQAITAVSRIINVPSQINVDFADLKVVLKKAGTGIIATGRANGKDRAAKAIAAAIENPLVDMPVQGAQAVLYICTGGESLSLAELNDAGQVIAKAADEDAQVFFGMAIDHRLGEDVEVVLVATHLSAQPNIVPAAQKEYRVPESIRRPRVRLN